METNITRFEWRKFPGVEKEVVTQYKLGLKPSQIGAKIKAPNTDEPLAKGPLYSYREAIKEDNIQDNNKDNSFDEEYDDDWEEEPPKPDKKEN